MRIAEAQTGEENDHEKDLLGCNCSLLFSWASLCCWGRLLEFRLRRQPASKTWCSSTVPSPMAPAGMPSQRSLRRMATRCRCRRNPRLPTPRTKSIRRRQSTPWAGPVVLVGHSYGGSVITEAGNDPNVAALVYIAAFALDEGESCASIEQAVPQASKAFKPDSDGNWWIDQDHFAADFAADIPPAQAHSWL
jgi:pimeloyl-ACP methyl ester carboxylesterase